MVHSVLRQSGADGVVICQHAEERLEALLGDFWIGGGRSDFRNAGAVVDARGWVGAARFEVADDAIDFLIDELLRNDRGLLGIALIVLHIRLPGHRLAGDAGVLGVQSLNGHQDAVGRILAVGGGRTGHRSGKADGDNAGCREGGCGGGGDEHGGHHTTLQGQHGETPSREMQARCD